ncbi:hypothetical protein [Nodularia sphaerocarpa]|uniref:hypothetical protein n=1 Tax=Nodularia sphaerocarpa TaxID=137816 RepID=UPI00232DB6F8|nr:hypothetical protein [Nodularia sphaerocarpa]MDB9372355.1 hypothetical protein [Nodularia sphaerocarpa CS-585]MDB9377971.1 hypothetical protein [Nodularia sphaerocarpa CS-585A2]
MKRLFRVLLTGAIPVVTLGFTSQAIAIPYNSATVYKGMDGANQVVVFSGTPGGRVSVSLGSAPRLTARIVGSCGEVRISPPSSGDFTGLEVDGVAVDASALPVQSLPSCVSGAFAEARTANFKTAAGQVVIVNKTPGSAASISLPAAVSRNVSIGACGFGVLRPTNSSGPIPASFSVGATNYTLASLPDAVNIPICRTVAGTPYGYVPDSWP